MNYPQSSGQTGQLLNPIPKMEKDPTSLDISLTEMDNQLSRFYNGLNRLDTLSNKLKLTPPAPSDKNENSPMPSDHCGKFEYQNGIFNGLNNQFEALIETLSRII